MVDLFGKLDCAQDKIEQFRKIEDKNVHVLGNFVANFISKAHSAKSDVVDNLRIESKSTVEEIDKTLDSLKTEISNKCQDILNKNKLLQEITEQTQKSCNELLQNNLTKSINFAKTSTENVVTLTGTTIKHTEEIVENIAGVEKSLRQLFTIVDFYKQKFNQAYEEANKLNEDNTKKMDALLNKVVEVTKELITENQSNKRSYNEALTNINKPIVNVFDSVDSVNQSEPMLKKIRLNSEGITNLSSKTSKMVHSESEVFIKDHNEDTNKINGILSTNTDEIFKSSNINNSSIGDVACQIKDSASSIHFLADKEKGYVDNVCTKLTNYIETCQKDVEHVVHQEIQRESHSGRTPTSKLPTSLIDASFTPIPSKEELLKETARTPQRASIFRQRDTILESFPVQSPNTLKTILPSVLKAQAEEDELP